ncbi:MAG: hypothetical protein HND48_04700 [Chloroflexi bacterium]|nr:hypothetical protein [Chloroflexota bacterium]
MANTAMGLEGVDYTVGNVHLQGLTAAVSYDADDESGLFGQIVDTGGRCAS